MLRSVGESQIGTVSRGQILFMKLLNDEMFMKLVIDSRNRDSGKDAINTNKHSGFNIRQTTFEIVFLFFPEDRIWHFMQIVCIGYNLQICMKCQIFFFWEKETNINNLASAELAQRVVNVELCIALTFTQTVVLNFITSLNGIQMV